MSPSPKISIVLPVYNGAAYLEGCLRSILGQSFLDFELLVGDDGSQDGTAAILDACKDPRLKRLYPEASHGLFRNLNRLVRAARGELIHIFCQDDRMEPHCLAETVRFHETHPGLGMSFCKYFKMDERGTNLGPAGRAGDLPDVLHSRLALQQLLYHGCLPGNLSTVCLPREVFTRCGYFDERQVICGDYEMWARIAKDYPLGAIQENLVRIRGHEKQLSRITGSGTRFITESHGIRRWILDQLPDEWRPAALRYERVRHHVNGFHHWLRLNLGGHRTEAKQLAESMGHGELARASIVWLFTVNHRLYVPRAPWVLTQEDLAQADTQYRRYGWK